MLFLIMYVKNDGDRLPKMLGRDNCVIDIGQI